MIRTQIYIPEIMHKQVSQLAQGQDTSMASIVRALLQSGLKNIAQVDNSGKDTLKKIANLKFTGGPADISVNHDYYLYGDEKTIEK